MPTNTETKRTFHHWLFRQLTTTLSLCLITIMMACSSSNRVIDADILVLGDSLLDFHSPDADIATVAGDALGYTVEHGAVSGTTMLDEADASIPGSYTTGEYELLIASGGGNDLADCECGVDCEPIMDRLIATNATNGAIVDMIRRAIDDGHKVAWVGYMRPKPDADEFATCGGEVDLFRQRLTALDAELPSMIFVDGAELGTGLEDELYEEDGYHPSELGSEAIGLRLAAHVQTEWGE